MKDSILRSFRNTPILLALLLAAAVVGSVATTALCFVIGVACVVLIGNGALHLFRGFAQFLRRLFSLSFTRRKALAAEAPGE